MKYRKLGSAGIKVSTICLGTQQFGRWVDEKKAFLILDGFADLGGNFIDTADCYPMWQANGAAGGELSEIIIGQWLARTNLRDDLVIATKFSAPMRSGVNREGVSRKYVVRAVEASLARLKTDYIDLLQTHDDFTDVSLEEKHRALDDLITSGKVRYIGCSNFAPWRLMKSLGVCAKLGYESYVTVQNSYSYLERLNYETEMMDLCISENIGMLPCVPLAKGFLTGKYSPTDTGGSARFRDVQGLYFNRKNWILLERIKMVAKTKGVTSTQVALAWLMGMPGVISPVVGLNSMQQLHDACGSQDVELTNEDRKILS